MANYQITYGVINSDGTVKSGTGIESSSHKSSGRYTFRFKNGGFSGDPAVVLTGYPDAPVYSRINLYTTEDRKKDVSVDSYDLSVNGTFAPTDATFQVLAICKKSTVKTDMASEENVKVVAGILGVGADAKVAADTSYGGFSVSDDSTTGSYILTFTEEFAEAPVVVATVEQSSASVLTVHVDDASTSGLELVLQDENRTQTNGRVHFIAIGKSKKTLPDGTHNFVSGVCHREGRGIAGEGFKVKVKGAANYTLTLTTPLTKKPVVVATAEHMKEQHVRQLQVHAPEAKDGNYATLNLDVFGKEVDEKATEKGKKAGKNDVQYHRGFNNSHFHFIVYTPA